MIEDDKCVGLFCCLFVFICGHRVGIGVFLGNGE